MFPLSIPKLCGKDWSVLYSLVPRPLPPREKVFWGLGTRLGSILISEKIYSLPRLECIGGITCTVEPSFLGTFGTE